MMNLKEYRNRNARLADYLPWAGLVGSGVVLNKDGSFQRTAKFRGPDLDSAVAAELVAVAGRINNAVRRLGSGWSIFVEAQRNPSSAYPDSLFPDAASALVDAERRAGFEEAGTHFVSGYFLTFLWLPPAEEAARAEGWLYEGRDKTGVDPWELLRDFIDRTDRVLALLDGFMPECRWLDDAGTLTYLHSAISTNRHRVRVPEVPMQLDALLADQPLTGGLEPRLGEQHLRILTIVGFPTVTTPGLLDEMNRLAFPYRWSTRAILMDKTDATKLLTRIRRQWFAKRKSVAAILKEVMTNEQSALVDTDAANKAADADMALQELGADMAGMAYVAVVVSEHVDCDPRTLPDTGGNCAVITLTSEGGNYVEGLRIAHFLREHAIASWVETGSWCYSACAFAFLGGSGQSSAPSIGAYIDRTIEPGATLGFHAPYVTADSLGELVAQYGVEEVLGGNRDSIALMIQELVGWNVDDGVLARITSMGADQAYTASTAQDLFLLRTALPDAPRQLWAPDPAEALRNACMRLLAHHEDVWPYEVRDRLSGEIAYNIGTDDRGWALSGYRLTGHPGGLTISYCATHTSDAHLGANADIALYYGPSVEGHMRPALTFFHRPEGWSTLATGGTAAQRIFQRGTIGHFFLLPEAELSGALAFTWRMVGEDFLKTGRLGR